MLSDAIEQKVYHESLGIILCGLIFMDSKSQTSLELPEVLKRLASHTVFSAGRELALRLEPSPELSDVQACQKETDEARMIIASIPHMGLGEASDVRASVNRASREVILLGSELLEIKTTLVSARELKLTLSPFVSEAPRMALLWEEITDAPAVVDAISRTLDDRAEVLDSASKQLTDTRRNLRICHDNLLQDLQSLIDDPRNLDYLQDPIITQRGDRYVIPVKAHSRGRFRGIVHAKSSSGATLFIEPIATVELNNRLRELQSEEEEEILRIMAYLSSLVAECADLITSTVEVLAKIDLCFAKARYSHEINASAPILLPILPGSSSHSGSIIRLRDARHPLLDPKTVVPIDVVLDDQTQTLVITGPNTGGKTVSLKTVGLLALMGQCGLHIPAKSGSEISIFGGVYADIGDEQSIEQNLSTFSSHITNIVRILKSVNHRGLVLLDEVGAGTDPSEGSVLARALLDHLMGVGATTIVTSHHKQLKIYAHKTLGMMNASVDFDPTTLLPTYTLTMGLPGRSNALAIAGRLGLDKKIITQARMQMSGGDQEADDLLEEIHRQLDVARQERSAVGDVHQETLRIETELTTRLEGIDEERNEILTEARTQVEHELEAMRAEIKSVRRSLAEARLPLKALQEVDQRADELETNVQAFTPLPNSRVSSGEAGSVRALRLGDTVWVERMQVKGIVGSLSTSGADVQIGRMRLHAQIDELTLIEDQSSIHDLSESIEHTFQPSENPGMELHIRGQRIDDALDALDRYMDAASLAELPWVRIIHGKGTGRLRSAVRKTLRRHPLVHSFEAATSAEGGEGVTVARLTSGG